MCTIQVHQRIEEFRDNLPVIQTLGNPDMKERHWEKVSENVGFPLKADAALTLARIIDFGLGDYNSKFQVISESATKENNLEKALNKMIEEWVTMEFSVVPYRLTKPSLNLREIYFFSTAGRAEHTFYHPSTTSNFCWTTISSKRKQ
jgi:Dynein heavy chain, N-terminal region 2